MNKAGAKNDVFHNARLTDLMTATPMSAEAFAALQRKRTESRRMIEDLRMATQAFIEPYSRIRA